MTMTMSAARVGPPPVVAAVLGAVLVACASTQAAPVPSAPGERPTVDATQLYDVQIHRVAEGIYVATRPEPLRLFVEGNVTIIINERDVVVVDAGGAPQAARNVIAEIKKLTPNPVRYVINTHIHRDHRFGLQEYVKAFPGVEIVAHPGIRDIIAATSEEYMAGVRARIEGPQREVEEEIARLRAEPAPGNEKVVAHLERLLTRDIHAIRREYRTVVNTPPTLTVDTSLVLHRGKRRIQVLFLGAGDTPQDLVVYLPEDKVVCAGDMVVHPFPYGYSDQPLEWLGTLGKLAELDFEHLVPGHGEVQRGKEYLRSVTSLLGSVQEQVRRGVAAGLDLAGVRARVDLSRFEAELAGDDPVVRYYFRQYFSEPNIERTYRAVVGRPSS
jgi:cyclase